MHCLWNQSHRWPLDSWNLPSQVQAPPGSPDFWSLLILGLTTSFSCYVNLPTNECHVTQKLLCMWTLCQHCHQCNDKGAHALTVTGVDAWLRPPEVLRMRGAGSREHPQAITPTSPSAGILKGLKRKSRPLLERL